MMNDDIKYFAKKKGSSEPPKPIPTGWASPTTHVKGLLQYIPSTFEYSLEYQRPKEFKDFRAMLLGYARPSSIKRIRKRQIEKAIMLGLTPFQKKQYKVAKHMMKAALTVGISMQELTLEKKHLSVTNRKRWK